MKWSIRAAILAMVTLAAFAILAYMQFSPSDLRRVNYPRNLGSLQTPIQRANDSSPDDHPDMIYMRRFGRVVSKGLDNPSKFTSRANDSSPDDHPDMIYMRRFGRVRGLPSASETQRMTEKELLHTYHSYLDNMDYLCHRKLRMGRRGDGGWEVCDDYEYRPIKPCIVYSFGINDDFSFDDDVGRLYGCQVFSFDPSMNTKSHRRSDRVLFFDFGVQGAVNMHQGTKLASWSLKTFSDIQVMLNHNNKTIDVLKMDIELDEWLVLENMLDKGQLAHVRQLLVEFHIWYFPTSAGTGTEQFRKRIQLLSRLESLGFRRFYTHMNPWARHISATKEYPDERSHAYELYFVNTRFIRQRRKSVLNG